MTSLFSCGCRKPRQNRVVTAGSLRLAGFFLRCFLVLALCRSVAEAQEPRALLQKTIQSYQALASYSGQATVTSQIIYKGQIVKDDSFGVVFKCRRPNRLMLEMSTPAGTRKVYSDGTRFCIYSAAENLFMRFPSAADMHQTLGLLVAKAGVFAFLDPLYFVCENHLPTELSDLKFKSSTEWNGHRVYIVSGMTRVREHNITNKQGQKLHIPSETRQWTWWIDRQTGLLWKVESRSDNVPFNVMKRAGKKLVPGTVMTSSITRHIVTDIQPNAAIADADFQFIIPPGAHEKRPGESSPPKGR